MSLLKQFLSELQYALSTEYTEEEEMRHNGLVHFFISNETPSDEDVQEYARTHNIDYEEFEEQAFELLHNLLKGVGKNNNVPDDHFDPDQLAKGVQVEFEHTNNALVAKMIAKDHLMEIPDYYDRLLDMEQTAHQENNTQTSADNNDQ